MLTAMIYASREIYSFPEKENLNVDDDGIIESGYVESNGTYSK